jgi:hypothetical protein
MAAAVVQEPEALEVARITQVEDLPDPVRADIVARRENGETLAELKTRFAHIDPAVIREVLPAGNARERKARERTTREKPRTGQQAADTAKPVGGKKDEAPKPAPAPRYVEGKQVADLTESVVAARRLIGRTKLAELLHVTGSAVWRFEHGRVHPEELDGLISGMSQVDQLIAQGEFVKQERQPKAKEPSRPELAHRVAAAVEFIETVRGDKSVTKSALADGVLVLLDPPAEVATETQ